MSNCFFCGSKCDGKLKVPLNPPFTEYTIDKYGMKPVCKSCFDLYIHGDETSDERLKELKRRIARSVFGIPNNSKEGEQCQ